MNPTEIFFTVVRLTASVKDVAGFLDEDASSRYLTVSLRRFCDIEIFATIRIKTSLKLKCFSFLLKQVNLFCFVE